MLYILETRHLPVWNSSPNQQNAIRDGVANVVCLRHYDNVFIVL
jgi:hypothetical protein